MIETQRYPIMAKSRNTAKVFMSGASQAVRLPQEYRVDSDQVGIHRIGRHIVLSPKFSDWDDYWANAARPSDDFVDSIINRHDDELAPEERASFS